MKIFCLGLSRTGTKSLIEAVRQLGYLAGHFAEGMKALEIIEGNLTIKYSEVDQWDALGDTPVIPFYQDLDKNYPNSKFILTTREIQSWLASCERHLAADHSKYNKKHQIGENKVLLLRKSVYGATRFSRVNWEEAYHQHLESVQEYFSKRQGDLLTMNIIKGDGWEDLCKFLDKPLHKLSFPNIKAWEQTQKG